MSNVSAAHPPELLFNSRPLKPNERYLGLTFDESSNTWHHVLLLGTNSSASLNWNTSQAWAEDLGGRLPSLQELSLIHTNTPDLKEGMYWSNEVTTYSEGMYAWVSRLGENGIKTYLEHKDRVALGFAVSSFPFSA